jgi:hypothetical protein
LTVGDGTQVGRYRLEEPKLLRYQGYIFFGFSTSIGFVSPTLAVPTGFTLDGGWYADLGDFEVSIGSRLWFGKPSPAGNAVVCFVADPSDLNAVKILSSTYPDTFASSSVIQWDLRITLA